MYYMQSSVRREGRLLIVLFLVLWGGVHVHFIISTRDHPGILLDILLQMLAVHHVELGLGAAKVTLGRLDHHRGGVNSHDMLCGLAEYSGQLSIPAADV